MATRPKIEREVCYDTTAHADSLPWALSGLSDSAGGKWVSVVQAPAYAPRASFVAVMDSLVRHPERSSSNILRADILSESEPDSHQDALAEQYIVERMVERRILPRRPNLDWPMDQTCTTYVHTDRNEAAVVYTPLAESEKDVPFYHPKVRALAFRFLPATSPSPSEGEHEPERYGTLQIDLVPFSSALASGPAGLGPTHRLSRVALALLTTLHTHMWGHTHDYTKRVHHDLLVPREAYQDLYLDLKARHANRLISNWAERTDPHKHVFEDLGIAAFLILLFRQSPPPGGFVDVGCGNGVLTHILTAEGYSGFGFDLRARRSWDVLPNTDLRTWSIDAPEFVANPAGIPKGAFLIGNHADELTPWLPLLAHASDAHAFLNIPCCPFHLDGSRFTNTTFSFPDGEIESFLPRSHGDSAKVQIDRGQTEGSHSRNEAYLRFLSHAHIAYGWILEKEALRIPSTKNWALLGRSRTWQHHDAPANLEQNVRDRIRDHVHRAAASWKARTPEGKAGQATH